MTPIEHLLVIPVYNDWRSLNKLLFKIDLCFKSQKKINNKILIINDNSSEKIHINYKKLKKIKKVKIITLKNNLGSQKAIAVGLNYIKKFKKECFITVMDSDGEDSPFQLRKMLAEAIKNPDYVITANRKRREEPWIIVLFYKIHLCLTFFFTLKWISFGNFTTFHKGSLQKLLSDNSSWYAHSGSVLKNCKIKRLYSKREKRYYDKSKLGLPALIEHSLRVNSVFIKNILLTSSIYLLLTVNFLPGSMKSIIILMIVAFNLCVISIKYKHWVRNFSKISYFIKKVSSLKTL